MPLVSLSRAVVAALYPCIYPQAAIFISRDLARRGWRVIVYANPPNDDVGDDEFGVTWRRWYEIDAKMAPEAFVAWRNPEAAALLPRARRRCAFIMT